MKHRGPVTKSDTNANDGDVDSYNTNSSTQQDQHNDLMNAYTQYQFLIFKRLQDCGIDMIQGFPIEQVIPTIANKVFQQLVHSLSSCSNNNNDVPTVSSFSSSSNDVQEGTTGTNDNSSRSSSNNKTTMTIIAKKDQDFSLLASSLDKEVAQHLSPVQLLRFWVSDKRQVLETIVHHLLVTTTLSSNSTSGNSSGTGSVRSSPFQEIPPQTKEVLQVLTTILRGSMDVDQEEAARLLTVAVQAYVTYVDEGALKSSPSGTFYNNSLSSTSTNSFASLSSQSTTRRQSPVAVTNIARPTNSPANLHGTQERVVQTPQFHQKIHQLMSMLTPLTSASFKETVSSFGNHESININIAGEASFTWFQHYKPLLISLYQEILSKDYLKILQEKSEFRSLQSLVEYTKLDPMTLNLFDLQTKLDDVKRMMKHYGDSFGTFTSMSQLQSSEVVQYDLPLGGISQHQFMVPPPPKSSSPYLSPPLLSTTAVIKNQVENKRTTRKSSLSQSLPFQSPPPIDRRDRKSFAQHPPPVQTAVGMMEPIAMEENLSTFLWGDEMFHSTTVANPHYSLPSGVLSMPSEDVMSLLNSLPATKEEFMSSASSVVTTASGSDTKKRRKSIDSTIANDSTPSTPCSTSKRNTNNSGGNKNANRFDQQKIQQDLQEINMIISKATNDISKMFESNQLTLEDREKIGNSLKNINLECRVFETIWSTLLEEKKKEQN